MGGMLSIPEGFDDLQDKGVVLRPHHACQPRLE